MRKAWMVLIVGLTMAPRAECTLIDWADSVVSSSFVLDPQNALGAPDNAFASWGNNPGSATYAYSGGSASYNSGGLAALLGISPTTLGSANFIAFEVNGSLGIGFEGSRWSFDDGSAVFNYTWVEGSAAASPVVAAGSISFAAYAAFFGLSPLTSAGEMAYLLFDVPVDVSSAAFQVTLISSQQGVDGGTPDPDVMGRLVSVPEPSSLALVALALAGTVALKHRRR